MFSPFTRVSAVAETLEPIAPVILAGTTEPVEW